MQNEAKTRLFSWLDTPLNTEVPKKETKNKLLFGLTIPIYLWHIVAGILLHCTNLYMELTGNAYRVFAILTALGLNLETWSALHGIVFFLGSAIFTLLVALLNKDFSKRQRLAFILLPVVTLIVNLIALAIEPSVQVHYSLLG